MKASELVQNLVRLISEHGDLPVRIMDDTEAAESGYRVRFKKEVPYTESGEEDLIIAEFPNRFIIR